MTYFTTDGKRYILLRMKKVAFYYGWKKNIFYIKKYILSQMKKDLFYYGWNRVYLTMKRDVFYYELEEMKKNTF